MQRLAEIGRTQVDKLTKRHLNLILELYNDSRDSKHTKNFNEINAGLQLAEQWPDLFECEKIGFNGVRSTYNFRIKRPLGWIPVFLKENNIHI